MEKAFIPSFGLKCVKRSFGLLWEMSLTFGRHKTIKVFHVFQFLLVARVSFKYSRKKGIDVSVEAPSEQRTDGFNSYWNIYFDLILFTYFLTRILGGNTVNKPNTGIFTFKTEFFYNKILRCSKVAWPNIFPGNNGSDPNRLGE